MTWHDTGIEIQGLRDGPVPAHVADRVLIVGSHEGRVWAIEDRCSHAGCAFTADGEFEGSRAVCNCHGSEFDVLTGEAVVPPATLPLQTFEVRIKGGVVEVKQLTD